MYMFDPQSKVDPVDQTAVQETGSFTGLDLMSLILRVMWLLSSTELPTLLSLSEKEHSQPKP